MLEVVEVVVVVVAVVVSVVVTQLDGAECRLNTYKQYLLPSLLSSSHHVQTGRARHTVLYFVN